MQKLRYDSILRRLKKEGLRFSRFSLTSSGEYAADDADWNYKDIPHLHYVHALAEAYPVVIGEDVICNINLQKILGIWYPITVVIYELEKNHLVYFTTLFFFTLIIETRIEETAPLNTSVTTTYNIGYPPMWGFAVPALRWLVKRNYKALMKDDIPMRTRRGELRKLGYGFLKKGDTHSFIDTVNIYESNVALPAGAPQQGEADYQQAFAGQNRCFIGDKGLLGLRLDRDGNRVTLWPRACPHEGASLDDAPCKEGVIHCPWHGRVTEPLGSFNWGEDALIEHKEYRIEIRGSLLRWQYRKGERRAA